MKPIKIVQPKKKIPQTLDERNELIDRSKGERYIDYCKYEISHRIKQETGMSLLEDGEPMDEIQIDNVRFKGLNYTITTGKKEDDAIYLIIHKSNVKSKVPSEILFEQKIHNNSNVTNSKIWV